VCYDDHFKKSAIRRPGGGGQLEEGGGTCNRVPEKEKSHLVRDVIFSGGKGKGVRIKFL